LKRILALPLVLLATGAQRHHPASAVVVRPILSTDKTTSGRKMQPTSGKPGIVVSMYEIAPGAKLPVHKHRAPRFGYLIAGTLVVENMETGKSAVFHAGDFIVEDVDEWHRARQVGATPIKLLVTDQVGPEENNVIMRAAGQ
jgi:quercetin dioxygenase-like cupin family protein